MLHLIFALRQEMESFEGLGIDYEEKAFYDILIAVREQFQFEYPDDKT
ncbi:MAG: hypothetical protein ACOH2D_10760 [Gelidibacter sp.]